MSKFICDCGARFSDSAGVLACASGNHGQPRFLKEDKSGTLYAKTPGEIRARLAEIDADDRYHYPPALIQINAPLALIQVSMKSEANALAWVLGIDPPKAGPREKGKKK